MDLSQSDLIRNFILMRLPEAEQTRLYETYWSKIEGLFRGSENAFDAFVRDYLALRSRATKQQKADEIYFAFRREFRSVGTMPERLDELLDDLLRFARYHAAFSLGAAAPESMREPLARLRRQLDVPAILVMRLFECQDVHGTLEPRAFVDAIGLIESYVFRRAICGEQTRGYWQVFANLAYQIEPDRPLESLAVGLARQHDTYRFPDDTEFHQALTERDIYGKRLCFELLDRLENEASKERTDTRTYSIEHIMPQNETLSAEWREMLGSDWAGIKSQWLHRLGNLTLTGYNSKYSDRPFAEKKTISGGFEESSIRLNKYVRQQAQWTPVQMEARGELLARQALGIWPRLEVDAALVQAAELEDMRQRAKRRDVGKAQASACASMAWEVEFGVYPSWRCHLYCLLASKVFPPLDRHIDVGRRDLEREDAPPLLLAGDECGARPGEGIVDVAFVIMDGSLHALNGLLGRVAGFRFPGVVNLPEGRGFPSALPVGFRALFDSVPARLVSPVVVPAADHDVPLIPDDERASDESAGVETAGRHRKIEAAHPDVGD